jgi:hypothetical protein
VTTTKTSKRGLSPAQVGFKHGFRSGLEDNIARELEAAGIPVDYESLVIPYIKPQRNAKYTPDFPLPNGIIVESKGRFVTEDRQKHLLVKTQHPDLDIRFVFSNPNTRISKQSKTTYAMWCEKHSIPYAAKLIPKAWLKEAPEPKRVAAMENLIRK